MKALCFPFYSTLLISIFSFLQRIDGQVKVTAIGQCTNDGKVREIFPTKNLSSHDHRGKKGIGGAPKDCGVAQCRQKHRRKTEERREDDPKRCSDGKKGSHLTALKACG